MIRPYTLIIIIFIITSSGCKDSYNIPIHANNSSALIVEGNLNNGAGNTRIRLTRSNAVKDPANIQTEERAEVSVEGNNYNVQLQDQGNGYYGTTNLSLVTDQQYKLRIKTANGKQYLSENILAKNNPPIDSVNWVRDSKGVTIYANTHDAQNKTRYYRWEYEETWEIHSYFTSSVKYENDTIIDRLPSEYVKVCWKNDKSSSIILGSSAKLQSDVIFENPIITIYQPDEKLRVRYSILLKQYALTKEAYYFYEQMNKNTESLGSVFDAQPSEVGGNIHSLNDSTETVIGLVTISPVNEKRMFIDNTNLPEWIFDMGCVSTLIPNTHEDKILNIPAKGLPYAKKIVGLSIVGYYISSPECVDCTAMGGSLTKPAFW